MTTINQTRPIGGGSSAVAAVMGLAVIGLFVGGLSWAVEHATYDVWGAFLVGPVLLLTGLWYLSRTRPGEDASTRRILMLSLVLKMAGGLLFYAIIQNVYEGVGDAGLYHESGVVLAKSFRHGDFVVDLDAPVVGTGFMKVLVGLVYSVIGPSRLAGYLVFAWLGFWGLYLFHRAFKLALPDGDTRRYTALVTLLPSHLYWASSIGKEAWMMLALGVAAYGAARVFAQRRGGFLLTVVGLGGAALIRPHVAALMVAGISFAYLSRPRSSSDTVLRPLVTMLGIATLALAGYFVVGQAQRYFGVDNLSTQSVRQVLDETKVQTSTLGGKSDFTPSAVRSPADLPRAALTVLFRPYPWEAHNPLAMLSSFEGLFLLVLFARAGPTLRPSTGVFRRPIVVIAVVYSIAFVYAFSTFGQFGLLARERVQLLPFALVLLALPAGHVAGRRTPGGIR